MRISRGAAATSLVLVLFFRFLRQRREKQIHRLNALLEETLTIIFLHDPPKQEKATLLTKRISTLFHVQGYSLKTVYATNVQKDNDQRETRTKL
jgi:hypothetical protein